jgi:hypothetical protein
VTRGWFVITESPTATSTVFTAPKVGNANSTFIAGTTTPEADAVFDEEGCEARSSETVGIDVGVAEEPQAVMAKARMLINAQSTFFIIISPDAISSVTLVISKFYQFAQVLHRN